MTKHLIVPFLVAGLLAAAPALADSKEMVIETFRVAPGKHEEFLRHVALLDRANAEAGLPPRQFFVHQGGASWDFVILQPAHHTDEESAKLDAAYKKLGIPQGAKFFVNFRQYIAEHTDTTVEATTAAEYLKKLD
ncbi:MAG TPA: hypothetical protein VNO53_05240 [Steroidobacteraceae bacterium]|nr:hypothetical protein [Steroidobacteraceae bacterium]